MLGEDEQRLRQHLWTDPWQLTVDGTQNVLMLGGIAALSVSIAALLWPDGDDPEKTAEVRVTPMVSTEGGAVRATISF